MSEKVSFSSLRRELKALGNKEKAAFVAGYFKTGKGEYGEGDVLLGITVPVQRRVAKKYMGLRLEDVVKLLHSPIHEERFVALEILVMKYERGDEQEKKQVVDAYLNNLEFVNNWDLVDTSAKYLLGEYLRDKPRKILYKLAKSKNIWQRRVAIITTHAFIDQRDFADTLTIAASLLQDSHDLIHKAVGWMLREVGNKSQPALETFLKKHGFVAQLP
ncbi:MAG: DNA alkylation repair protein [Candidatus Andersenbacteria bacterium]|nr:DNA alkylation repair protein [Candidatus Andersenbacteria bacterium]